MGELLPTLAAHGVREGLLEFLETTFALSDDDARVALQEFLQDPDDGIFKGPYLRTRLPFRPAADGWRDTLGWHPIDEAKPGAPGSFAPYGHQAEAFARLSSANLGPNKPSPQPTLVTTGTGSGKTEAFLYPILDHVLRAKAAGIGGMKALILYPMNALANDQAQRLAGLITTLPGLAGVTAGLFTGQEGPDRTKVRADGLITNRHVMRSSAPDILLTNYKMLDQMLLRHADARIWEQSATSLQYLVLDEFHTYDGAQGTDVAMLLRRLGLTLRAHGATGDTPLAQITPIATSATLGDKGDPGAMLDFASLVFGQDFAPDAVVTESRLSVDEWIAESAPLPAGVTPLTGRDLVDEVTAAVARLGEDPEADTVSDAVIAALYQGDINGVTDSDALRSHPMTRALVEHTHEAAGLRGLAEVLFPGSSDGPDRSVAFLTAYAAALSHVRKLAGRSMPSVEVHLWVRELTRIDREAASTDPTFWWSDDGSAPLGLDDDDRGSGYSFPAIYCRHCGRSGWGVALSPADASTLDTTDSDIRRGHASGQGRFRPLLLATREGDQALTSEPGAEQPEVDNLRWFHVAQRQILTKPPVDEEARRDGSVLPVLTHVDSEADEASHKDLCPACQQRDGIRFLGSAVATQLSVGISTIFGSVNLDQSEKKTLVFTDSVQDAAHRAGFVQSRSHSLTVRSMLRQAVGDKSRSLDTLAERVIQEAGDSADLRFRILPPDLADKDEFRRFWQEKTLSKVPQPVLARVRKRISFDAVVEFGLQSRLGRTLEMTGSLAVEVEAPRGTMLIAAKKAIHDGGGASLLPVEVDDARLVAWVRGVLERMRERGSIEHDWLHKLIQEDGARHFIWRGRAKSQGMPAFPIGRTAPAFPRVGPKSSIKENVLDPVSTPQSWYAQWTMRVLRVSASEGAVLSRILLKRLAEQGVIRGTTNKSSAEVYAIPQDKVVLAPIADQQLAGDSSRLVCRTCKAVVPGTTTVVDQLDGAPCMVTRCAGQLERTSGEPANFYRRFFAAKQIQRVVAREHTSLLDDAVRQQYEDGFKDRIDDPSAPNVLVATPTLEMGIDIGDLTTVMLASLPRNVASYLQRVGRAGRLTGSALNLAFVSGRGEQLPQLGQPLSMINGKVRPPATYLDAEEILRRQYVASLADRQARDSAGVHPERTSTALGSMEPTSFLHVLVSDAETSAGDDGHLDHFLACFPSLDKGSVKALREWVTPVGDTTLTSPIAARMLAESKRWHSRLEALGHRITQIEAVLPALLAAAEVPLASDDDKDAYRSAQASLGLAKKQRAELTSEYWISALEEAGILPNYTLLDDSVTLDIGLSWLDPDSGEYATENVSYSRNAALALREFAPGATFYAGGAQAKINTVDLGHQGEAVREWVFCPACGYSLDVTDGVAVPAGCPRCGSNGIADVAQRLAVVELTRVSSSMRRDEASIDDSRDDRVRESFEVITTADYTPADVGDQWFVKSHGFGAKHVTNLRLTWLNVGRSAGHGSTRFIAGNEVAPELFRVCSECGQLDRTANRNSKYEHRPWCSLREESEEDDVAIALSRTLQTEGLVLRLPPMVAVGSSFAVPSLAAAIKLGLREHIGGAPDHLAMETVVDAHLSDGSDNADALLIHDLVPGGTGYLADLSNPENLYRILYGAYRIVRDCECADGGRIACHLCLLPFAGYGQSKYVSRVEAERVLLDILTAGAAGDEEPAESHHWDITREHGLAFDPESKMEQKFRQVFKDRLAKLGATVKEHPESKGVRLEITLGRSRQWSLEPQVNIGSSKPDFVLRCTDPNVPSTAIFCDGWKYHASPQHNNLAEDARKREELRELGFVVLGFTWADLDSEAASPPAWFMQQAVPELMKGAGISLKPSLVDLVRAGPLDLLLNWIQSPDPQGLSDLGRALPFLFAPKAQTKGKSGQRSDLAKAAGDVLEGHSPATSGVPVWAWREDGLVVMCRLNPKNKSTEIAVVIDDRTASLGPHTKATWGSWLRISNLLALRSTGTTITTLSRVGVVQVPEIESDESASTTLTAPWQALVDVAASPAETAALTMLADYSWDPPVLGYELNGLPLSVSWPGSRIALDIDLSAEDRSDAEALGWTVVPAEIDRLREAQEGSTT